MSEQVNLQKYELANKWIHLINQKKSILENLKRRGIDKIIIYGASDFALRLMEQCENEQIVEILAISDKLIVNDEGQYKEIPLISLDKIQNFIEDNTCVVITAMGYCEEIVDEFRKKGIEKFILLSDLKFN